MDENRTITQCTADSMLVPWVARSVHKGLVVHIRSQFSENCKFSFWPSFDPVACALYTVHLTEAKPKLFVPAYRSPFGSRIEHCCYFSTIQHFSWTHRILSKAKITLYFILSCLSIARNATMWKHVKLKKEIITLEARQPIRSPKRYIAKVLEHDVREMRSPSHFQHASFLPLCDRYHSIIIIFNNYLYVAAGYGADQKDLHNLQMYSVKKKVGTVVWSKERLSLVIVLYYLLSVRMITNKHGKEINQSWIKQS